MNNINLNQAIKAIIFLAFGVYISNILLSGKVLLFLHPRMHKFLYFALVIFAIMFLYSFSASLSKKRSRKIDKRVIIFLIPILCFTLEPKGLSAEAKQKRSYNVMESSKPGIIANADRSSEFSGVKPDDSNTQVNANTSNAESQTGSSTQQSGDNLGAITPKEHTAGVNTLPTPNLDTIRDTKYDANEFLNTVLDIYEEEKSIDHEFTLVGFIYREDFFKPNQFMVGRLLITCCIADSQSVGIYVQSDQDMLEQYPNDTWVELTGVAKKVNVFNPYDNKNVDIMSLQLKKIEKVEPAKTPYVYFE